MEEQHWQLMRPCVRGRDLKSVQLSVAGSGSCRLFARRPLVGSGYLLLLIPVGNLGTSSVATLHAGHSYKLVIA
jgi:hypothetical protein